ncbi:hypothetical protein Pla144_29600 [Bythopirellula polymerisocia]|uniref:Uncharacterized protein n=1 Tax=Bythopirellula polymerisocia TaxID=2528003 RepID=A0A5C6CMU8_9BACT|nr:hypothetical protein Pla144_29600 [Bythopirellula polymerisocia]
MTIVQCPMTNFRPNSGLTGDCSLEIGQSIDGFQALLGSPRRATEFR